MAEEKRYKTERLKCWDEAKNLRKMFYEDYYTARERGGLLVAGSANMYYSILAGLGRDVHILTGEPYGATTSIMQDFSARCMEAVERSGVARDLCAYLRNYWGSIMLDKFMLADGTIKEGWPKPDFHFTSHACCTHAKWYQRAGELEGGVPFYGLDACVSPHAPEWNENQFNYMVQQLAEAIPWMEKVTGRKYNDELLIEAVNNEWQSSRLWGEICMLNKTIPAPLDEKSMFSLYILESLQPYKKETVEFYTRVRDEIQDRVDRGIAAAEVEKHRIMTGASQPPWSFINIWRYLQREYGIVSVGSFYTFGLQTVWEIDKEGHLVPARTPKEKGIELTNREEALRAYVDFKTKSLTASICTMEMIYKPLPLMVKDWSVEAVVVHANRGCEGSGLSCTEPRLDLLEQNIPVLTFEGSMADYRDFDLPKTMARVEAFLEGLGWGKLSKAS